MTERLSQLVQVVERILKGAPNVTKSGDRGVLAEPVLVEAERSQTGAAVRQRRRHTVENADAVEQRAQRTTVLLERRGTVGVEADVDAVTFEALRESIASVRSDRARRGRRRRS